MTVTRTYSVTDCSGNSINVYQTINVDDTTPPTASNPADINILGFDAMPAPDVTVVTDESDNCDGDVTVAFVSEDIDMTTIEDDVVTVTRTYSVTDCTGNSINVEQTIYVTKHTLTVTADPQSYNFV